MKILDIVKIRKREFYHPFIAKTSKKLDGFYYGKIIALDKEKREVLVQFFADGAILQIALNKLLIAENYKEPRRLVYRRRQSRRQSSLPPIPQMNDENDLLEIRNHHYGNENDGKKSDENDAEESDENDAEESDENDAEESDENDAEESDENDVEKSDCDWI
jgi:Mg-chelatase subunit ChlI